MRERNATKKAALHALLANVRQATGTARLSRGPGRIVQVTAATIKELRGWTQLSQPAFAALLGVELSTLRNWEQGRREPTGPARALLRAIHNDPESVIRALEPQSCGLRRAARRDAA
jgi:putative transcriptional regulator